MSTAKQPSTTLRCRRTDRKTANLSNQPHLAPLCPCCFAVGQAIVIGFYECQIGPFGRTVSCR